MNIKVKIENQTFEVNVGDLNTRPILATVDGQTFEVWPEEMPRMVAAPVVVQPTVAAPLVAPVAASAPAAKPAGAPSGAVPVGAIPAPIPGVIVLISVKEGETVKKGQELVVLEAMKMKNSIRSNRDGVIGEIKVKVGDHVTHGQALIAYKD
jgi:glutaconyl-CoA/methylmalonyl-CoA decarboxylase subunit gamma